MNNENVSNNIIVNNDTSLDKCNRDIMGNREDDATLLDDDENDNRSLESQMSTTSNRRSSSDSVGRRQSKDNPHHDQQQVQQRNTNDDDDVDTPFKDGSEDEVEPTDVTFSGILFDDKKLSWHLEQALSIILRLGSAVLGDQYDNVVNHLKQVEENRVSSIASVQEYFELELYQEDITKCQDAASGGLSDYISSLEGGEESDSSSEPPSFDADDESMLSSGSKGESDQDEQFSSSTRKRGLPREGEDGDPPPRPRKQRSRPSKAASDDESQDESQMHQKDQDDDETDQSQSKANKQQEKEDKDREKAEQQEKVEDAKYDAIPEEWKQVKIESSSSDRKAILAVVTDANDKTSDYIDRSIDPHNPNRLDNLWSLLDAYMTIIHPSIRGNSLLASRSKAQADGLASVVGLGGNASISKLLLCCDDDNNEIQDEDPEVTAEWELVREAILECNTKMSVEEFLVLGTETKNMLMHLLHSRALQFIFSKITLVGVTAHLSDKASAALTSAMKELAQLVDPEATFSLSMVVLSFMKQFALPGLVMNGARGKTIDVIIDIFGCLTYVGRSDDQKKAYKKNVLSLFERLDASTISGDRVEGHVSKYFSGDGRQPGDRRKHVVRLGLALYLKTAIEDLLGMRDSGQYTRGILRLSATDISRKLSKDIKKALFLPGDFQIKAVESMKKYVLKKKSKSRTLLIESDEQMDCLMHLINKVRTFSDDEQPT